MDDDIGEALLQLSDANHVPCPPFYITSGVAPRIIHIAIFVVFAVSVDAAPLSGRDIVLLPLACEVAVDLAPGLADAATCQPRYTMTAGNSPGLCSSIASAWFILVSVCVCRSRANGTNRKYPAGRSSATLNVAQGV